MEILAVVLMVIAGGAVAALAITAMSIARAEGARTLTSVARPRRDEIAGSLLFHVVSAGGPTRNEALRLIRRGAGLSTPVTSPIDVASWAETFAGLASPAERADLLETAVKLVARPGESLPLRQYAALMDLSFGLGFQTDALARLRTTYGFDYVDHARDGRTRAERSDDGSLHVERLRPAGELLKILGVEPEASRRQISAAYRRLAAQHHPDRFHERSPEEVSAAAMRFIEISRAYEELMTLRKE